MPTVWVHMCFGVSLCQRRAPKGKILLKITFFGHVGSSWVTLMVAGGLQDSSLASRGGIHGWGKNTNIGRKGEKKVEEELHGELDTCMTGRDNISWSSSPGRQAQVQRCRLRAAGMQGESIIAERFSHQPGSEVLLAASVASCVISCQPPLPGNLDSCHGKKATKQLSGCEIE